MENSLPQFVIIVAGGTGSRMQSTQPKQFLSLGDRPVIAITIGQFFKAIPDIKVITVVHADWLANMERIIESHFPGQGIEITTGGATRFASVKNGLLRIGADEGKVAVHDAVRPFVHPEVIASAMEKVEPGKGVVPATSAKDSIRQITANGSQAVDRSQYRLVQTPQCFMLSDMRKAYQQAYRDAFTDDASVMESMGMDVELMEGNEENIKLTTPMDMQVAGILRKQMLNQ